MSWNARIARTASLLRCPVSGSRLEVIELPAGRALRGRLRDWPVVFGIAYFREGPETDRALAFLEEGDQAGAAAVLAAPALSSRADRIRARLEQWLLRRPAGEGPAFRRHLRHWRRLGEAGFDGLVRELFGRPPWPVPATAEYFIHRRADPSFVTAEALAGLLLSRAPTIADVGCGTGHLLASLAAWFGPERLLIGIDPLFPALLAARELVSGEALLVCAGAGALPLAEGAVSGLASVDAFFDFENLPAAAREMRRVLAPGGVALIAHLHNRLVPHIYSGRCPLTPQEYLEVLAPLEARLVDERLVLARLLSGRAWSLSPVAEAGPVERAADLIAVGGAAPGRIEAEGPLWPAPVGPWRVNPLYERVDSGHGGPEGSAGQTLLRRRAYRFISEEEAAGAVPGHLPEDLRLPRQVVESLPSVDPPPALGVARWAPGSAGASSADPSVAKSVLGRVLLPLAPSQCWGGEPVKGPGYPPPAAPRPRRAGMVRALRDLRGRLRAPRLARTLRSLARQRLPRGGLALIMVHRVVLRRRPSDLLDLTIPRAVLERALGALSGCGELSDFGAAIAAFEEGRLPAGLTFALTFDDGTEGLLEGAVPLLERHGIKAAVFVSGEEAVRGGRFLWDVQGAGGRREDPVALAACRWLEVGHHGRSHRPLEALASRELSAELAPIPAADRPWLAYPFGGPEAAGPRAVAAAREFGFRVGLTTRQGLVLPGADPMLLPRIPLYDAPEDALLLRLMRSLPSAGTAE